MVTFGRKEKHETTKVLEAKYWSLLEWFWRSICSQAQWPSPPRRWLPLIILQQAMWINVILSRGFRISSKSLRKPPHPARKSAWLFPVALPGNSSKTKTSTKNAKKRISHTTVGIRWWSPTQLLIHRSEAWEWQSERDALFSSVYGRMCKLGEICDSIYCCFQARGFAVTFSPSLSWQTRLNVNRKCKEWGWSWLRACGWQVMSERGERLCCLDLGIW